jgi:SAM-dependent methyltransferase
VEPKPAGWSAKYAAAFGDADVVAAYHLRPPYPDETIAKLATLARGGSVLDAGCGTGELARRLAPLVERVDAVDVSAAMVAEGRMLPGADAPNLTWLLGPVEDTQLAPPYSLVVAGDSVHWFDWPGVWPRLQAVLGDSGLLAIVNRDWLRDERARKRLRPIYSRHSWNADFAALDPIEELEQRALFVKKGEHVSAPAPWRPTLDEIVGCHFSMSGFGRSRLRNPETFNARSVRPSAQRSRRRRVATSSTWSGPSSGEFRQVPHGVSRAGTTHTGSSECPEATAR